MLCTGTGVAPFISTVFELEVYNKFEEVALALTCRKIEGLQYLKCRINQLMCSPETKPLTRGKDLILHQRSARLRTIYGLGGLHLFDLNGARILKQTSWLVNDVNGCLKLDR
ncbi:MAG: hypothetical protein ACKERG_04210 [Candidatus Hodgkinia cicadicola]